MNRAAAKQLEKTHMKLCVWSLHTWNIICTLFFVRTPYVEMFFKDITGNRPGRIIHDDTEYSEEFLKKIWNMHLLTKKLGWIEQRTVCDFVSFRNMASINLSSNRSNHGLLYSRSWSNCTLFFSKNYFAQKTTRLRISEIYVKTNIWTLPQ